MTHEESKHLYLAYREKAREVIKSVSHIDLDIAQTANVQMTENGAFVECTVWVSKDAL